MKNYSSTKWQTHSFKKVAFTLLVFLATLVTHVNAQSTANYAFTTNTTGSLGLDANGNVVDMSTGTTQLVAADLDDVTSAVTSIGFSFSLMGTPYTQFFATSNGIVQLGASAPSTTLYTLSGGSVASPRLGALAADLRTGSAGKVHYKVVGTAPNRCLVVEFLNMSVTFVTSPGSNDGTYQVRLYETTGAIEYVYGSMYKNASTTSATAICSGFSIGSAANTQASITTASNTVSTGATFNLNAYTASTNIPNLHSTTEGARRVYLFTPPIAAAPTALNFTGVGATIMTLNWTDNATTEYAYQVYRSLDGITYTLAGTLPANSITYSATGLSQTTNYFWKVVAVSEAGASTPDLLGTQMTTAGVLSGIKTVGTGGDYNNLTTAFAAINAMALSGNVELQLIAGYPAAPETYPIVSSIEAATGIHNVKVYPTVSGLSITSANATGTLDLNNAYNITFDGRVNQTGANDLVIANTNAGTSFAVRFINDARNNTLSHCIIQSANTSTTSGTIVIGTTTGTNGNDNNTIDNCDIRDAATTPVNAIYGSGTTTTATHYNDNITISNNNISNFFSATLSNGGVFAGSGSNAWTISNNKLFQTASRTYTAAGVVISGIQVSHSSGNGFVITGNTIGYASSTGTGVYTMIAAVNTRFMGINVSAGTTAATSIQGNTITAINFSTNSGATSGNGVLAGINVTGGAVNVGTTTPNVIGAATGTDAITATVNSTGGLLVGINSSSSGTVNISNNIIGSLTAAGSSATVSASITGIQVSAGTPTIHGNTIGSTTTVNSINSSTIATSGSQLVRGIDVSAGNATSIQSNTIVNLNQNGTTTGSGVRGISFTGTGLATISLNTVYNLSGATASTGSSVAGILHSGAATGGAFINGNTVYAIAATNTGAVQNNAIGIAYAGPTAGSVTANRIYDIRNASTMAVATTPPTASGILVQSVVTSATISNNMISVGDAQTTNTEFIGIWNNTTSAGTIRMYNNSISISGTAASGALPSYGFLRGNNGAAAITSAIDFRNNIVSNSRLGGTGKHYAIANQSTVASTTGWGLNASNYNLLNAAAATVGLWGATDGTFNDWRLASSGDANSFSGMPATFVNVPTADLHLNMGVIATPIESGGNAIAGITTDYDGDARPGPAGSVNGGGTAPDLGADEIDGVPALPIITLNSVTPPAAMQCATAPRVVSVNVTTPVGTIINASIGYSLNGVPQTPIAMTNTSGTTWEGTIPASTPVNATVAWGVSATNSSMLSGSYTGTPYTDEPLAHIVKTASASPAGPLCAGTATDLSAILTYPGPITLGAGASTTSGSGTSSTNYVSPFTHYFGGYKAQYVIRASELTAAGLSAGNLTSVAFDVTTAGTTYNGFTMNIAPTAATAASSTFLAETFTEVYTGNLNVATTGLNTITFSTPFNWDGTSNIVIQLCWSNNNGGGTAAEVKYDNTSFVSTAYYRVDNDTPAEVCPVTVATAAISSRPKMVFAANVAIAAISWSDGVVTVGTTNPLSVTPTVTTTYTATITAMGCTVTPAPAATVVVNPLPTAPTATNSAQCGTQIPTASVTSTSGLLTPTFKWYDAAAAGTMLQSSTSATYTSNVAATTTFYVSELNTTTGCESARTPVTVTVALADGVSASAAPLTICIGSTVTLTAANTNPTPLQSYTYSWSGLAGSGAETPVPGASVTITPTVPGTYTYDLTAVDGGCSAVATVSVTVDPFAATLVAVNATCNGVANGSFTQGASTCGTLPYTYSVDGGAFGAIPTNLAAGAHSVIVKDANNFETSVITVTVGQPSITIAVPTAPAVAVCENSLTAQVAASSMITEVVAFNVAVQPTETNAAPGNIISSATYSGLPAGAVVTSATLTYSGLTAVSNSWMSDIRLGLSGAITDAAAAGTGTTNAAGTFTYTRSIPLAAINATGGTVNLLYWDYFSDNAAAEATFPTGAGVATLTINYTTPTMISWWDAATAGTQLGTGSPFETVGTSVLPNTNTPGTYTVYAQGQNGACPSPGRTAVVITVKPKSTSTLTQTACDTYTLNGTTYNTSGTYTQVVTNALGCDSTITLNLTIKNSTGSSMTQTACVSYTLNGTTYNTSGTYTQLFTNAVGCDSVLTLNLTINQPNTSTVTATACSSYTLNGTTYNTSGTYTQNLTNVAGCDSVLTLNLTINQPTTSTVTATACSSYTLNGTTYNASGTFTQVLTNVAGCDSTITLNLTINQPTTNTISAIGCNSVTVNGTTYNASGSYTQLFTNAVGCDSTLTINVTLNNTFNTITDVACGMYSYNGTDYTVSGTYMDTLTNMAGCDSIVTLNLTINQPTSSTITDVACGSYELNGTTYTTSGVHTQTLTNAAGCDSTITLNLTINQPTTASMTVSECVSFTYNGTTYTTSGTFTDVLTNAAGCDSVVTINLTIIGLPVATATDNANHTITASAGASYQWVHCATGLPIAGATAQTYTATVNGSYAVVVTNAGGCSDTSNCVVVSNIGIDELTDASIQVFPNPTHDNVTVTMSSANATLEVVDVQGKLLQAVTIVNGGKVDLSAYETGVYFLRIQTDNGSAIERIVKN